jgi:hypothetical protein
MKRSASPVSKLHILSAIEATGMRVTRMEPTPDQRDYLRRFRAKGGFVPLAIVVGIVSLILLGALYSFIQGDWRVGEGLEPRHDQPPMKLEGPQAVAAGRCTHWPR